MRYGIHPKTTEKIANTDQLVKIHEMDVSPRHPQGEPIASAVTDPTM